MDYLANQAEISLLRGKLKYLSAYSIVMSLSVLALLVILLQKERQVVVVPPVVNDAFTVTQHTVSESYLTQMSDYFLSLALNKSPGNARHQTTNLLSYVEPSFFDALKAILAKTDAKIAKENISTSFFPVRDQVWPKAMIVKVTGDFVSKVGDKTLPTQRLTYLLKYHYVQGRLHIVDFKEIKKEHTDA